MTKTVRIENADTAAHIVVVEVWMKREDGTDQMASSYELSHPTALAQETIWGNRYLIIREKNVE